MTTLIISSIIALLGIAGAAIAIGKWIDWQSRSKRFKPFKAIEADYVHTLTDADREMMRNIHDHYYKTPKIILARGPCYTEAMEDEYQQNKLIWEAKEILKQKTNE